MEPDNRIINATFIGKDGSLGYRNGRVYSLLLNVYPGDKSILMRECGGGYPGCEYSNEKMFLRNWTIVRHVLTEKTRNGLVNWEKFKKHDGTRKS